MASFPENLKDFLEGIAAFNRDAREILHSDEEIRHDLESVHKYGITNISLLLNITGDLFHSIALFSDTIVSFAAIIPRGIFNKIVNSSEGKVVSAIGAILGSNIASKLSPAITNAASTLSAKIGKGAVNLYLFGQAAEVVGAALKALAASKPLVTLPSDETITTGQTILVTGVSVSETTAVGSDYQVSVVLTVDNGTIDVADARGDVTTATAGTGLSKSITIVGSIEEVNTELTTLFYTAGMSAGTGLIDVEVTDEAGNKDDGIIGITINTVAPPPPPSGPSAVAWGDVHLTTFDGLLYNFQAVGEFVLTDAAQSGDSYQIQIRLQPYGSSTSVSVMTEIAAAVGTDRVTFSINRGSTVWIDGTASTLGANDPTIALNGGTLTELSSNQYQITWNTGEVLTVTDVGAYLSITTQLASSEGPGSIKGLLGSDTGAANDFQLADGTIIGQPLTSGELYGEFANAWRVTQATSLLDYGAGQTTATFTDLNFPYQPASLADFSAAQVAQAAQLVAAAGITDPNVAAGAELDYLETNDSSFITADAATTTGEPNTTPAVINPTPDPVVTAPAAETVTADQTIAITGVSVSDPSAVGSADLLTLSVSTSSGAISMTDASGDALAGSGTGTIDVSGSLEQLNADLATLSYTAGNSVGSASVTVNIVDQAGVAATGSISVTVNPAPDPVVTAPTAETVTTDEAIAIAGVSISDPSAIGSADLLTLSVSASSGAISMTDASGDALAGSGTGTIDVSGSLEQLNADLATLSYTAGNSVGSASVAVNIVDQAGVAATGSISVTVTPAIARVFSDNFNSYAGQYDWTPPANWTAPGPGSVDLIGETTSGTMEDLFPGNGGYVDLDGSNGIAGTLQTMTSFAPGTYTLTFDLGGNALGDVSKTTVVTLGSYSTSITLPSSTPLQAYTFTFQTTGGNLSFQDLAGGNQNIGNILDNVTLSASADPVVTAPAAETVTADQTIPIAGVSISDPSAIGSADLLTLSVSASSGIISMTDASGSALAGSGSGTIDVSGSLEQLNADLATLSYTAGSGAGSASVALNVVDQAGVAGTGAIGVNVNAPTAGTGFDGDQVSLGIYDPNIVPADLFASGTATVTAGTTTFPSFAALGGGVVNGSLTVSGDQITFLYPTSEKGAGFATGSFNGYVLTDNSPDAATITGVSLVSTDITGFTDSDLTFGAHNFDVNVSGLTLPTTAAGSIDLLVAFAGQTNATSFVTPSHT